MSTRLDELRTMRDFIDREIDAELERLGAAEQMVVRMIAAAAELYGVAIDDMVAGSRKRQVIRARQAACWLLRNRVRMTLPRIGQTLGVDHTTALHACRKIDASPATRALLLGLEALA